MSVYERFNPKPPLSDAVKAEIRAAYEAGGITAAAATCPHLSRSGVWRRLRSAGLKAKRDRPLRDWTMIERERLIEMRRLGMPTREIARHLGRTKYSVDGELAAMIRANVVPRKHQRRFWTSGTRSIIDRRVDQLVDQLASQFDRTPSSIAHEMVRSLRGMSKRRRNARILDLGGMTEYSQRKQRTRAA